MVQALLLGLISGELQLYWAFAIIGSTIFLIQLVLSLFLGFGGETDVDGDGVVEYGEHADLGLSAFRIFSLRSIIAFIAFFGWGGVLWGGQGPGALFAAFASGLIMMFISALLIYFLMRLQQSGNIQPTDFIGLSGVVYLTIPGGKQETGLVTVTVRERTRQIRAVAEQELPTGTSVRVKELVSEQRFLVEKL